MSTKSEIIRRLNNELPEQYAFVRKENPRMRLSECESFPTLLKMEVGKITHEYGTEAALKLTLTMPNGETCEVGGASYDSHHNSECDFSVPKELEPVMKQLGGHLVFNILCEEGLDITKWNELPE